MTGDPVRDAAGEARIEAAPAALLAALMLAALGLASRTADWGLAYGIGWEVWLLAAIPELLLALVLLTGVGRVTHRDRRREVVVTLLVVVIAAQTLVTWLLIATMVDSGNDVGGIQLLASAIAVWVSEVVAFGLGFWELDLGGPVARALAGERRAPDLMFPQDGRPHVARAGWHPRVHDYLYVSLTNSFAFSPTDTMPLTARAKALMAFESVLSLIAIVVVAARAVNILG